MLKDRVITGLIAIPVIVGIIFFSPILLFVLTLGTILLAMREYYELEKIPVGYDFVMTAAISLLLCFLAYKNNFYYFNVFFTIFLISLLIPKITIRKYDKSAALIIWGNIYIAYFFSYVLFLKNIPVLGSRYLFFIFLLVWVNDTASYFIGVNFGRHKLSPVISPNKTKEGAIGGVIGSVIVTVIAKLTFLPEISFLQCFIIGIFFSLIAQFGDLFESALKRKAEVKDSGNLIPGHGGILDRFDSLFFTLPSWYWYIKLVLSDKL